MFIVKDTRNLKQPSLTRYINKILFIIYSPLNKLKADIAKKEAEEAARKAVRSRAKKIVKRDDDDSDIPRF